jgi:hypothetical protein
MCNAVYVNSCITLGMPFVDLRLKFSAMRVFTP